MSSYGDKVTWLNWCPKQTYMSKGKVNVLFIIVMFSRKEN